jgi:ferredoxin
MSTPIWFISLIKKLFPLRSPIARLTRIPVIGKLVNLIVFEGDTVVYLPKDSVIQVNENITRHENMVLPSQVVEHFIKIASQRWIMNFCLCRSANDCKDYPQDTGCIFLGDAVLQINPKFGHLASVDEALEHARQARSAGLVHMVGRNKLDAIWLGAMPPSKLLTICSCCPCCCLWRLLPDLNTAISDNVQRMVGVELTITRDCIGCGLCTQDICFVNAIHLEGNKAVISQDCRGCGRCVEICPQGAIQLALKDQEYLKKTISRISAHVNVNSS